MDSHTETIIERARQRRDMLAKKLGETPEAVPRKRRTPLVEDNTENLPPPSAADDDSPKRHCVREKLQEVKPDTPAISSVRSRMNALTNQRGEWSADSCDENDGHPPPQSRGPVEQVHSDEHREPVSRKSRLANLAQTINCWEDDLSHPNIAKEEPQKPRWRPPTKPSEPQTLENKPPRQRDRVFSGQHNKGKAPSPPQADKVEAKPVKYQAPKAPPLPEKVNETPPLPEKSNKTPPLPEKGNRSPLKISTSSRMVSPAKPLRYDVKQKIDQTPINIQEIRRSTDSGEETDEPTKKPVTARMAKWVEKTTSPVKDPIQQPISARFAKWEERVSQTPTKPIAPKTLAPHTPKQSYTPQKYGSASKAIAPVNKFGGGKLCSSESKPKDKPRESVDPSSKPVSERMAKWQEKVTPQEEEPTAYSVNARMSAWEHMSSANQVSYIKKVEPGSSPAKIGVKTPPCSPATKAPSSTGKGQASRSTPTKSTSNKPGLKSQKSFAESILEKATEIRSPFKGDEAVVEKPPRSVNSSPGKSKRTPQKSGSDPVDIPEDSLSPTNASNAMKTIHQRLMEQTTHSTQSQTMAERLREERMRELASIQNRWQNGILQENPSDNEQPKTSVNDHSPPKIQRVSDASDNHKETKRDEIRANARSGSTSSQESVDERQYKHPAYKKPTPPAPPPLKFAVATPTNQSPSKKIHNGGSSLLHIARKGSQTRSAPPVCRQKFDDGFDSDNSESSEASSCPRRKSQCSIDSDIPDTQDEAENQIETEEIESQESDGDSSFERFQGQIPEGPSDEGDDVSLSAFVPASVRRQSVLPNPDQQSLTSQSSNENISQPRPAQYSDKDRYVFHQSEFNIKGMIQHQQENSQSTASLNSNASSEVSIGETYESRRKYYESEETETEDDDSRQDMGEFLDEAIDDHPPIAAPRKRRSHMMATENDANNPLMYSVSMYRSKRYARNARPPPKMVIKRTPVTEEVQEEEFSMPTTTRFSTAQTQSIEEKIRELTELGNQELSVIKQTSNALNQCCMGNSSFAGSAEQAECNRLLLISSQRRMAYMSEIQRLKDQRTLEPDSSGPKGSLTISEMRLPLKREFVTKLGTSADSAVHYFIILIRNGPHIIVTEMLSTHDERMRGSLDFPNHININDITGNFQVQLEIYGMSIVREMTLKDKKKNKTPKKGKKDLRTIPSPGGPNSVMTSSFKLIAVLPITMKSVDKACFNLEKVPYVSPIYGTIYMRLKCTKEANVQERGFLTMFEDVSGLGAWHRRWCVLSANKICFWKYPDDETRKEPMGYIDLKRCITEKVGVLPRDICARQHTFELTTIRQPRKGEQDTLVSKTYNTMTTLKHMLSADTKEERILWCNKINRALMNIRTWHSDAARPIRVQSQS